MYNVDTPLKVAVALADLVWLAIYSSRRSCCSTVRAGFIKINNGVASREASRLHEGARAIFNQSRDLSNKML